MSWNKAVGKDVENNMYALKERHILIISRHPTLDLQNWTLDRITKLEKKECSFKHPIIVMYKIKEGHCTDP